MYMTRLSISQDYFIQRLDSAGQVIRTSSFVSSSTTEKKASLKFFPQTSNLLKKRRSIPQTQHQKPFTPSYGSRKVFFQPRFKADITVDIKLRKGVFAVVTSKLALFIAHIQLHYPSAFIFRDHYKTSKGDSFPEEFRFLFGKDNRQPFTSTEQIEEHAYYIISDKPKLFLDRSLAMYDIEKLRIVNSSMYFKPANSFPVTSKLTKRHQKHSSFTDFKLLKTYKQFELDNLHAKNNSWKSSCILPENIPKKQIGISLNSKNSHTRQELCARYGLSLKEYSDLSEVYSQLTMNHKVSPLSVCGHYGFSLKCMGGIHHKLVHSTHINWEQMVKFYAILVLQKASLTLLEEYIQNLSKSLSAPEMNRFKEAQAKMQQSNLSETRYQLVSFLKNL